MLGAIDYADETGLTRFWTVHVLDRKTLERAEIKFHEYREMGVVLNDSYDDEVWILNDDIETVRLNFRYDRESYERYASWTGCSLEEYRNYAKAFAALCLGNLGLPSIRLAVKVVRDLVVMPYDEACDKVEVSPALSFLSMFPEDSGKTDEMRETLSEISSDRSTRHPRKLRPFRDYIDFNDAAEGFWNRADEKKKIYFFPVYLWWTLTTILPLRATEFTLMPDDCVSYDAGRYFINVRRTRLKKKLQKVTYSIKGDYEIRKYEVTDRIAEDISWYMDMTKDMPHPGIGTLFVTGTERYMTYPMMRQRLSEFSMEAGYTGQPMNLGDTRHLAMINLMLSGGSPSVCRELAGHESIDISSNYYANLSEIIKEAMYDYCHRMTGSATMAGRQFYPLSVPASSVRVGEGYCSAPEMAEGMIDACLRTFSADSGIGDCRKCMYFYPDDPGVRLVLEKEKQREVDADGAFLIQMIEQVRKGNGSTESIREAVSRLQNASRDYENLLYRRYQEEMPYGKDGKTKKD